jgi:hypothetical protein
MTKNNPLEKEIEKKLGDIVKNHGGLCLKWVCPGWSGVPDRILLLPCGKVIFAETKRPKGSRVEKLQLWWRAKLQKLGFTVWHIYNQDQLDYVDFTLDEIMKI